MATNSRVTVPVGGSAEALDIFIQDTATNIAFDPSGITFRIFDPLGVEKVTETSGYKLAVGHYSASGVSIPAGSLVGEGWRIDWTVVHTGGVSGMFSEQFCTTLPSLVGFFTSPSQEVATIYDRVRVDLGDINGQMFTDGLLQRTLQKSIARVNRRLGLVDIITGNRPFHFFLFFNSSIQRPKIEVNLTTGNLTPETDPYVDIVVLQMEEILLRSEMSSFKRANTALGGPLASGLTNLSSEGVSVTNADGVRISTTSNFNVRAKLYVDDVDRISREVERAIRDFRWRLSGAAGVDVTIPRYGYPGIGSYYQGYGGTAT